MKHNQETIKKAAKWWREKIQNADHHDNGASDNGNMMAMMLADLLACKNTASKEQLDVFEDKLIEILSSIEDGEIDMRCDYGPDNILSKAAGYADISKYVFPYKTSTYIDRDDRFMVSDGYGKPFVEVK
jgi:hypothetical protein